MRLKAVDGTTTREQLRTTVETLHLVRNVPPHFDGRRTSVEAFLRKIAAMKAAGATLIGTWTRRRPRRDAELRGGSVYFVSHGWTMFRMPFDGIERVEDFSSDAGEEWHNAWAIVCLPETTMVAAKRIYRLQGWRYLRPNEAPADVGPGPGRSKLRNQESSW